MGLFITAYCDICGHDLEEVDEAANEVDESEIKLIVESAAKKGSYQDGTLKCWNCCGPEETDEDDNGYEMDKEFVRRLYIEQQGGK